MKVEVMGRVLFRLEQQRLLQLPLQTLACRFIPVGNPCDMGNFLAKKPQLLLETAACPQFGYHFEQTQQFLGAAGG